MTAADLLATLKTLGATVQAVDGRLRIEAPPGAITPELRAALSEQKPALLELLRPGPQVVPLQLKCAGCKGPFMAEPAILCYWCRNRREAFNGVA